MSCGIQLAVCWVPGGKMIKTRQGSGWKKVVERPGEHLARLPRGLGCCAEVLLRLGQWAGVAGGPAQAPGEAEGRPQDPQDGVWKGGDRRALRPWVPRTGLSSVLHCRPQGVLVWAREVRGGGDRRLVPQPGRVPCGLVGSREGQPLDGGGFLAGAGELSG